MIDREKVISDIEQQIRWIEEIDCHKFPGWLNVTNAMRDALALIKEQEAVKPTWGRGKPFCGACGLRIHGGKFCSECGKPIAWEGR